MRGYQHNARWLTVFAPFRTLAISSAYLTPFLQLHGLSLTQVFGLQAIFSVALLLWEVPSGFIADKLGRALSIKLSAPIAAVAMTLYGFSGRYWQFVACELVLALANGLVNGIDTALLHDSLAADGREGEFVRLSQRINAAGFAAIAAAVPVAIVLVHFYGISSTIVADGTTTGFGAIFAWKLTEAPRSSTRKTKRPVWRALRQLGSNAEVRWLIALGATLNTATYLAAWLAAPYYTSLGVPVVLFSSILAIRNLLKAGLAHKVTQKRHVERNMLIYVLLAGAVYIGMASGQLWLIWVILGHDIVHALQSQPITARLNKHMQGELRATMNSVVSLIQRLAYSLSGVGAGSLVDHAGLHHGLAIIGIGCGTVALAAFARLHQFKTFQKGD